MVDLMLKNPREETLCSKAALVAFDIHKFDAYFTATLDLAVEILDTETTLIVFNDIAFVLGDDRIDERGKGMIIFVIEIVTEYDNAFELVNLDGSKCYANLMIATCFPGDGSCFHVLDELFDAIVDDADFL